MSIESRNFKFDQPTSGVSFSRLEAIEQELGGRLDDDFRDFLSKIDGGRPDPALVSSIRFLSYPIVVFLGLNEGKSNLIGSYKDLSQTLGRSDLVPIAYDTSLSRICLKIGGSRSPVFVVSIDELYGREQTRITEVCDSFLVFWNSLTQPRKLIPRYEELAERSWSEIQSVIATNPEYCLPSNNGELSLLCQTIRAENDEAFFGLVENGASLERALEIAVTCQRLDYVEKLVESGSIVNEGIPFAVGPSRKQIREFLEKRMRGN